MSWPMFTFHYVDVLPMLGLAIVFLWLWLIGVGIQNSSPRGRSP